MKKIVLLLAVLLFGAGSMMAQQDKSAEKVAKQAEKEAKKAEKAAKKAAEEAEANALFEQAVQALKNKDFVLEADRIEFKRGSFVYVTPNTNFVSVKGEKATIQLAFNTPAAGPNGIGGITVDGTTSGVQMKTDKKGNVMYEMNVQGIRLVEQYVTDFFVQKNKNGRCLISFSKFHKLIFKDYYHAFDESKEFKYYLILKQIDEVFASFRKDSCNQNDCKQCSNAETCNLLKQLREASCGE